MKFNILVTAFLGSGSRSSHEYFQPTKSTCTHRLAPLCLAPTSDISASIPNANHDSAVVIQKQDSFLLHHQQDEIKTTPLMQGIREWLVPPALAAENVISPPTADEIKLLREAFATFYGVDRDLEKSEQLLSKVIEAWDRQAPDEKAGLYRVRGDCYMALLQPKNAEKDYAQAIQYLQGNQFADAEELPTALLGRARAIRSQGRGATQAQLEQAAKDYQLALSLSSREDWDTEEEKVEDGASRNPFAAWEWGTVLRNSGDVAGAAKVHRLASESFDDIGDKTRSIISSMDAGIDLAAMGKTTEAKDVITSAIKNMKKVEGGDVDLLQRLLAKEGESRIALASVLWDSGDKQEAETLLGTACYRLEQLEADVQKRLSSKKVEADTSATTGKLAFSIDDQPGVGISCSRFRNEKFLAETVNWPQSLQQKVMKLQSLSK